MTPGALLLASVAATSAALGCAFRAPRLWLSLTLASSSSAFAAAAWVLSVRVPWDFRTSFALGGEAAHLHLDGLSAFFLLLLSVLCAAGSVYGHEYWSSREHPASTKSGRAWWSAFTLSMGLVLLAGNGLHFLIAWEGFAVTAYFLITLDSRRPQVREAGFVYLAASHFGTLFLFAFFALLASETGSWELGPMRGRAELAPLLWLALPGFGVKAGLFPLHVWLPAAHANAPSHVSAILSGIAIKMGIYGIARFSGWLPPPPGAGWVLVLLGSASAVLGVAFALAQHDLKRLLAYHSVENVGIITVGLGFALVSAGSGNPSWGSLALAGGLLHVWNHGLFKALLFLGAGSVLHATGTREMSRLGGLWRTMPWTASLFALGAAAISGLPPLNGFVSELLIYIGLFEAIHDRGAPALAAAPAILLLALAGALALACFVKVCGVVFLGAPRSSSAGSAHEGSFWMRSPMLALAGGCVGIGLGPTLVWPSLSSAASAWRGGDLAAPAPLFLSELAKAHLALVILAVAAAFWLFRASRRRGVVVQATWDCGYARPTPLMQYTAGSFAAIITDWFSWVLRPERRDHRPQGLLPHHSSYEEHCPETVLERVVHPAARVVTSLSEVARQLQHGRLQAYLLYLITGLAAVAALALTGGGR